MAGLYIKLDHDWTKDPKVRNFRRIAGKPALVDLVQLYVLMSRYKGRVDLKDPGQLEDALDVLQMRESRLDDFIGKAAECGIVDREMWVELRVVTSERAVKDASATYKRGEAGRAGGKASAAARARPDDAGDGCGEART